MRDELIKFERYQKQFHFLYDHDLETTEQIKTYIFDAENKINELIHDRSLLYGKTESKERIIKINKELKNLRKDVKMCKNILDNSKYIKENMIQVNNFEKQSNKECKADRKIVDKER